MGDTLDIGPWLHCFKRQIEFSSLPKVRSLQIVNGAAACRVRSLVQLRDPDLRYSSTISQREANEAPIENVQFPNIMLCTDSIHSKYKLRKMYPQVNDTLIQQFYGLDVDPTATVSGPQ